jgi:2-polyprenyl-6-hydroxyphenyl methylase/3-demethylubiquinone-9 3-methyltransferase
MANVDSAELAKFAALAAEWWDPTGPFRTLHEINELRTDYIASRVPLAGHAALDVGCGGGLLSEALAGRGAAVVGIDLAEANLEVARVHAVDGGLTIEYRAVDVEALASERPASFEVVACLEMLEHVPEPRRVVAACAALLRPGGVAFFSTINRNPKSFALAIVGAEYVLDLVPRGTHEYRKLIRPSELAAWCRAARLDVAEITGLHFNPLLRDYTLGGNVDVNYFLYARKRAAAPVTPLLGGAA